MGLIFFFSAQPDLGTDLGVIDLIGRKIAHAAIYACLTLAWWWALSVGERRARWPLLAAALISFLYAISDEYHQTFVEGRVGSPRDVAIDTVGIILAAWLITTGRMQRLERYVGRLLGR